MDEEDIQYGPYMLPEVTIEPEAQLSMPPLEGQGRAESTMSPIDLLLLGGPKIVLNRYGTISSLSSASKIKKFFNAAKKSKAFKKVGSTLDQISEVAEFANHIYSPISLVEKVYNDAKSQPGTQIIGADPNSTEYTTGPYADEYYIENGKVFKKPELPEEWIYEDLFSGDPLNPRFPSKISLFSKFSKLAEQERKNKK